MDEKQEHDKGRALAAAAGIEMGSVRGSFRGLPSSPPSCVDLRRLTNSSSILQSGVERHFESLAEAVGLDGRSTSKTTVVLRDVSYKVGVRMCLLCCFCIEMTNTPQSKKQS